MTATLLLLLVLAPVVALAATCDDYAYPAEKTKASSLIPNTFHKLCPSKSSMGQPICGDGTPFSFYYTSPVQRRSSSKILIEFLGGGACWDAETCQYNAQVLTFPYQFDDFLGLSCSELAAGKDQYAQDNEEEGYGDIPINLLCAQPVGGVDFREFHTIMVPYCTQDTHMGSNTITYDDGTTVHHRGAANLMSVLEWVYANFPHPDQIVLTGCSAGATALPAVYDLVHHHYNSWTKGKSTAFSTLSDSPVYLTPSYFMEQGLPSWNLEPLMKKLHFNYNKYSQSEEFSNEVINHVLKRGSKKDSFGMITHNSDPVSLAYFQRMSASDNDDDGRRLEDNQQGDEQEWWSELFSSIYLITTSHSNADAYIIDGEGHCSLGLYYALTEGGEEFEEWAGNVLKVPFKQRPTGRGWFWVSALIGCTLIGATIWHQRRMEKLERPPPDDLDEDSPDNPCTKSCNKHTGAALAVLQKAAALIATCTKDAPVTIAYGVAVTIYFVRMMTWDKMEVFFYNPSLGPSAATLSAFGINNPTLVVYKHQILRVLLTSSFLCSGIVTYAMAIYSLYYNVSRLEKNMRTMSSTNSGMFRFASTYFLQVAALIAIGSNLMYAILASGASCSTMALILGLQAFSCTMHQHHEQVHFPKPLVSTVAMFFFTTLFLPYNNWVMMTSAMLLGFGLAYCVYWVHVPCSVSPTTTVAPAAVTEEQATPGTDYTSFSYPNDATMTTKEYIQQIEDASTTDPKAVTLLRRNGPLKGLLAFFAILLVCLVVRIRRPNRMYEQPFLTGCELVYTSHVDEIVGNYLGGKFASNGGDGEEGDNEEDRNRKRRLEDDGGDNDDGDYEEEDQELEHMCAQFCVPHLVSRPFLWGANLWTGFDVQKGFCEDVGYGQHIADKTFSYKSYSIDLELFFNDDYDRDAYNDENNAD